MLFMFFLTEIENVFNINKAYILSHDFCFKFYMNTFKQIYLGNFVVLVHACVRACVHACAGCPGGIYR